MIISMEIPVPLKFLRVLFQILIILLLQNCAHDMTIRLSQFECQDCNNYSKTKFFIEFTWDIKIVGRIGPRCSHQYQPWSCPLVFRHMWQSWTLQYKMWVCGWQLSRCLKGDPKTPVAAQTHTDISQWQKCLVGGGRSYFSGGSTVGLTHWPLGPLLLTWFNFNPSMDK